MWASMVWSGFRRHQRVRNGYTDRTNFLDVQFGTSIGSVLNRICATVNRNWRVRCQSTWTPRPDGTNGILSTQPLRKTPMQLGRMIGPRQRDAQVINMDVLGASERFHLCESTIPAYGDQTRHTHVTFACTGTDIRYHFPQQPSP